MKRRGSGSAPRSGCQPVAYRVSQNPGDSGEVTAPKFSTYATLVLVQSIRTEHNISKQTSSFQNSVISPYSSFTMTVKVSLAYLAWLYVTIGLLVFGTRHSVPNTINTQVGK